MKKKPADLFAGGPVSPAKPATKEEKSRNLQIAEVSGLLAGIPSHLANASEALGEVMRRCQASEAATGILTQRQANSAAVMATEVAEILSRITRLRMEADKLAAHDAIAPAGREQIKAIPAGIPNIL